MEHGKITHDMQNLKQNIEAMGRSISTLSSDALEESKGRTREMTREVVARLQNEYASLRGKINEMGEQVTSGVKSVDETVHRKPYWFLAGAAGAGYLLAKKWRKH
jgi:ElaB/YqjD/DUF883 family membrane-anchored ribosome-binding protein